MFYPFCTFSLVRTYPEQNGLLYDSRSVFLLKLFFARSAIACRCSSVYSRLMYGFFPNLYGYSDQSVMGHILTSLELYPQQSRHFFLMALIGVSLF